MQAAIGLAQLDRLDEFVAARRQNWQYLRDGLADLEDVFMLPVATAESNPSWFGFCLTLRDGVAIGREQMLRYLNEEKKIGTPIALRRKFAATTLHERSDVPNVGSLHNSDMVMNRTFWVGVYPG